ncbi:MAG: hypothetical protein WC736_15710 [Gallionella sp.]|jgi:hypothetical protein
MKIIKEQKPARVNVAAVMVNYFLGGMVRALQMRRARRAVVPLAKGNKYEPHQGKKECERRRKRTEPEGGEP